jgi:hypothetical protein
MVFLRGKRFNSSVTPVDARRRWFGTFFLIVAIGMTIWGQTLLSDYLYARPVFFLCYWVGVFITLFLSMLLALLDMSATRKRNRLEQKKILEDAFTARQRANVTEETNEDRGEDSADAERESR